MFARLVDLPLSKFDKREFSDVGRGSHSMRSVGRVGPAFIQNLVFAWTHPSPPALATLFVAIGLLVWLEGVASSPETVAALFLLAGMAVLLLEQSRPVSAADDEDDGFGRMQPQGAMLSSGFSPAELVAAIIHEVNQPLSAMTAHGQACLRWFDRDVPDVEAARESADRMLASGSRAAEIIAGLDALARGSAPDREPVDLNDVVRSTLSRARAEIAACGVAVILDIDDRLLPVRANRIELEQVMRNLVTNAVQALSRIDGPRRLTIVSRHLLPKRQVVVEVRDNGPGLKGTTVSHLFEPFHTTKPQGMGMGLAISRAIIASLGGSLEARPNDGGRGACFAIQLNPVEAEEIVR